MSSAPTVLSKTELSPQDAKWITLQKIKYTDADGKERFWESAERKTRKSTGVDAVAVIALIKSKTDAFPISTVIIEQFRPPVGHYIIEFPAGLIDEGETAEAAAIRELEEETGFKASSVLETSDILFSDPGMTNANMKCVTVNVILEGKLKLPKQKLDDGEFIIPRVIELARLDEILKEYVSRGFSIDAKLSHVAIGFRVGQQLQNGLL